MRTVLMADVMQVEHNVRVLQEARTLIDCGYHVNVVGYSNREKGFRKRKILGVDCYSFYLSNTRTGIGKLWRYLSALKMLIGINLFILCSNYDIYHAHNFHTLLFAVMAAKIRRKRVIYDAHESWTIHREKRNHPEHIFAFFIEKISIPFIDKFISVNELVVNYYNKLYNFNKSTVLYNTRKLLLPKRLKIIHNELKLSLDKVIILFQGGFYDSMRGIYELIDAASYISDRAVIVFIGFGPEKILTNMKTRIEKRKVINKVFILPPKEPEELMEYTMSADIGMNLIKRGGRAQDFQSPWKLFEFCMARLAVISTDLAFHRIVYKKHNIGILVGPENHPAEIAEKVNFLINNPELLNIYQENARIAAEEEYCWEKQEKKLIELYRHLENE